MPRKKDTKRKTRKPAEEAEEMEETELEDGGETELETGEDEGEGEGESPALAPQRATDGKQVYFRRPDTGESQSFSRENYERLTRFVNQMPDRTNFSLFVYRFTKVPGEGLKRMYLGQIELPNGLLEDALKQQFGGGNYHWQLGKDGQFARKEDLPADTDDVRLTGSCTVAGSPKEADEPARAIPQMVAAPSNDAVIAMLKEQIKQSQSDKNSATNGMVQIMTVLLAGMQQQQTIAQQISQQQTAFMMNLMAMHDKKADAVSEVKDKMYERIFELVSKVGGGGEPDSPLAAIAKSVPEFIKAIRETPNLSQPSVRKALPPAVQPAPVPAAPVRPVPPPIAPPPPAPIPAVPQGPTDFSKEDEPYLTEVVSAVWEHFRSQRSFEQCAEHVANLGEEHQFDKLLSQTNDWVAGLTETAWAAFNPGQEVPEGLLSYARAVHMELTREVPSIPEARPEPAGVEVPTLPGMASPEAVPGDAPGATPETAPETRKPEETGKDLTEKPESGKI